MITRASMPLVLIVDEDKIVVNYLYTLFKLSGYEVNIAFSATECLFCLKNMIEGSPHPANFVTTPQNFAV